MAFGKEKVTSLSVDEELAAEVRTEPAGTVAEAVAWVASSTVTEEPKKDVPGGATRVTVAPGASDEKVVKPIVYSTPTAPSVLCDSDTVGLVAEVPMPSAALTGAAVAGAAALIVSVWGLEGFRAALTPTDSSSPARTGAAKSRVTDSPLRPALSPATLTAEGALEVLVVRSVTL
jgi:hypothetical protein